jgi:uncharacterized protein (DUF305 family)
MTTVVEEDAPPATAIQSRRGRWIAGALAAILLLGIGYAAGFFTPTLREPGTNSPEAGFARDMSTHHAQAVGMSMLEVEHGSNQDVVELAYSIATTQQAQFGMMSVWLQDWHLLPTGTNKPMSWMPDGQTQLTNGLMPGMATTQQVDDLTQARGNASDVLFCQLMLRHHLGGIHMVEGILALTHNSQVRTLAESMLAGQQGEVQTLQNLLKTLDAQPLSS